MLVNLCYNSINIYIIIIKKRGNGIRGKWEIAGVLGLSRGCLQQFVELLMSDAEIWRSIGGDTAGDVDGMRPGASPRPRHSVIGEESEDVSTEGVLGDAGGREGHGAG